MHGRKVLQQQLKCQNLLPYIKPVKKPDLPPDYCVKEVLFTVSTEKHQNAGALLLWRLDLSSLSECLLVQKTRTTACHYRAISIQLFPKKHWFKQKYSSFCQLFPVLLHIIKQCTTLKDFLGHAETAFENTCCSNLQRMCLPYNKRDHNGQCNRIWKHCLVLRNFPHDKIWQPWEIFTE